MDPVGSIILVFTINILWILWYNLTQGVGALTKALREGATYSQKDVMDMLIDFSSFKDRVHRKFKNLAGELVGKTNEHELWVNLYLVSSDYAEDAVIRNKKNHNAEPAHTIGL